MRATKLAKRVCSGGCRSHTRLSSVMQRKRHSCWGSRKPCGAALARCLVLAQSTNGEESGGTAAERGLNKVVCASTRRLLRQLHVRDVASRRRSRVWVTSTTQGHYVSASYVITPAMQSMTSCVDCRSKIDDMREN